jgi:nucleotide-binding universal stress UspA family protein
MKRRQPDYPPEELEPWDIVTHKPRRRVRKPTLASVAKQAAKAGIEVARYEVDPTSGKIVVVTGKPIREIASDDITGIDPNEWN